MIRSCCLWLSSVCECKSALMLVEFMNFSVDRLSMNVFVLLSSVDCVYFLICGALERLRVLYSAMLCVPVMVIGLMCMR